MSVVSDLVIMVSTIITVMLGKAKKIYVQSESFNRPIFSIVKENNLQQYQRWLSMKSIRQAVNWLQVIFLFD